MDESPPIRVPQWAHRYHRGTIGPTRGVGPGGDGTFGPIRAAHTGGPTLGPGGPEGASRRSSVRILLLMDIMDPGCRRLSGPVPKGTEGDP